MTGLLHNFLRSSEFDVKTEKRWSKGGSDPPNDRDYNHIKTRKIRPLVSFNNTKTTQHNTTQHKKNLKMNRQPPICCTIVAAVDLLSALSHSKPRF